MLGAKRHLVVGVSTSVAVVWCCGQYRIVNIWLLLEVPCRVRFEVVRPRALLEQVAFEHKRGFAIAYAALIPLFQSADYML